MMTRLLASKRFALGSVLLIWALVRIYPLVQTEPLMHPEIDEVIRHIRRHGMIAGMITNGFLLDKKTIEKLNAAGLEHLQISIDNAVPDEVSLKSLKTLDTRLEWLAQYAIFQVNINSVLGSGVKNPEDALQIAHRAVDLGFTSTVGIIHDHNGQLKPLGPRETEIFEEIMTLGKRSFSRFNEFQHNVARGREHNWRCRSGSRSSQDLPPGALLTSGEHKGYGLSLAVEILGGILSGTGPAGPPPGVFANGTLMICLDVERFLPLPEFHRQVGALFGWVKATPLAQGATEILIPGEPEARLEAERRANGIAIEDQTWSQIETTAAELGVG